MAAKRLTLSSEQRDALSALVADPIYELIPLESAERDAASLPAGVPVTVTASVTLGLDATLRLAERLAARGHAVAPHLPARLIRDRVHLDDVVDRMKAAAIRRLFVVGGDSPPIGEIRDGLALIRLLLERGHGFEAIGVPAYPEGHPGIPSHVLLRDLRDKQPLVQWMTTQMSFNPNAVSRWIAEVRAQGITLPIHLGLPGAVELGRLTRIAGRIGIVDSARYLMKQRGLLGHLLQRPSYAPETFLTSLGATRVIPASNVTALHLFTMNAVAATQEWQRAFREAIDKMSRRE
jgi:methylenetetrahydrofolate reductase (NADPH)